MAKINLLTRHYSVSYGAAMQAYATCMVLKKLGHQVTIINLQEKKKYRLSLIKKFRFTRFYRKHYPALTKIMYAPDISEIPDADFFLVGSDQVWNPDITKKNLLNYFLKFVSEGNKRISYASSFGKSNWASSVSENDQKKIGNELKKFSAISVREKYGVEICKDLFELNAQQVLDPTLLLTDYSDLTGNINEKKEIVCFFIGLKKNKDKFSTICDIVKKELKLKLVYLDSTTHLKNFDKHIFMPSPATWLKRMYRAKFIITSSFHGLAFSLIFKKPFIVLQADPYKVVRLKSLLSIVGLEDRLIVDVNDLQNKIDLLHKEINYTVVDKILEKERNKSIKFLQYNLKT